MMNRRRPLRTPGERALAQWRGYWEPQDTDGNLHSANDAVESALAGLGLKNRFDEEQVFDAWNAMVDGFLAAHARPVSLERKVLTIQVLHPTVHYELERMKGEILRKMQARFGAENIRAVRCRLG